MNKSIQQQIGRVLDNKSENEYRQFILKKMNESSGFFYANNPDRYSKTGIADITGVVSSGVVSFGQDGGKFLAMELKIIRFNHGNPSARLIMKDQFTHNQISFLEDVHLNDGVALGGLIVPTFNGKDLLIVVPYEDLQVYETLTTQWAISKSVWVKLRELSTTSLLMPKTFKQVNS